ncbi:hypothetical protein THIOSC15_3170005 [uncultured Thiomicrorhabdus sp.]
MSSNAVAADPFFDESFGNYQEDLQTAKEDGKKGVFVFFHMEECPFSPHSYDDYARAGCYGDRSTCCLYA